MFRPAFWYAKILIHIRSDTGLYQTRIKSLSRHDAERYKMKLLSSLQDLYTKIIAGINQHVRGVSRRSRLKTRVPLETGRTFGHCLAGHYNNNYSMQGHIRKNWKIRKFVLKEKATHLYYYRTAKVSQRYVGVVSLSCKFAEFTNFKLH